MNPSNQIQAFGAELDRRLSQLMAGFRDLHQTIAKGADSGALQSFFKDLFSLQAYVQQHAPLLSAAEAGGSESRERNFELLYKSGLILNAPLEAPALVELALDTVLEMCGCGRGFIATVTVGGDYDFIAARNFQRQNIPEPEREISTSVIQRALKLEKEVQIGGDEDDRSLLQATSLVRREGGGALICVPILIDHAVKGVIYLDRFTGPLSMSLFNLVKQFSHQLAAFMKRANEFSALRADRQTLLDRLRERYRFDRIIAQSKPMVDILKTVAKVAPTDAAVLIQGETGTGKDLIARAIHENSPRHAGPFIEVDCGALPPNLIESELFGYRKGAFTGALDDKIGLLEAAHGGTLFLDEINNLGMESQTKLLRVLQQRKIRRVGETRERQVDFRLVCASSKALKPRVDSEDFRQDLYYRINTVTLDLPPLRQRKDDLLPLVTRFLEKFGTRYGRQAPIPGPEVMTALECHDWPGNVRELEHVVERAVVLCEGPRLTLADLPFELHGMDPWERDEESLSLEAYLNRAKKYYIAKVLRQHQGKKVDTAKALDINRSYLFQLIKQLEIEDRDQ